MPRSSMHYLAAMLLAASLASIAHARPSLSDAERQRAADAQAEVQAALVARGTAAEERRLALARIDAAARLRTTETRVADLMARMDVLQAQRAAVAAGLRADADRLAAMLPLVRRLALYPAETLLAVPLASDDAVRGLVVLRGLATVAAGEAARLRTQEDALTRLEATIASTLSDVRGAQQAQSAQSGQLDAQIATARTTRVSADGAMAEAARRAATSAAQADGIRAMLAQLEADRRAAEARAQADADRATRQKRDGDAAALRQRHDELQRQPGPGLAGPVLAGPGPARPGEALLLVPVAGSLLHGWGDRTEAGPSSGISYATPPGARVVSPCTGRVAFAGPFRSFGQLLIVACGSGFHAVLAGLDRLDVVVGRAVLAGEPVGVMGQGMADARPALSIELRRGGQAVNPAPFLKSRANPSTS